VHALGPGISADMDACCTGSTELAISVGLRAAAAELAKGADSTNLAMERSRVTRTCSPHDLDISK
jgi:hypothetical protein